jgi:hypothetical protein
MYETLTRNSIVSLASSTNVKIVSIMRGMIPFICWSWMSGPCSHRAKPCREFNTWLAGWLAGWLVVKRVGCAHLHGVRFAAAGLPVHKNGAIESFEEVFRKREMWEERREDL